MACISVLHNIACYYLVKGYDDNLCQESVKWILKTQKSDGSWGFFGFSTAEETAYCLQALNYGKKYGKHA